MTPSGAGNAPAIVRQIGLHPYLHSGAATAIARGSTPNVGRHGGRGEGSDCKGAGTLTGLIDRFWRRTGREHFQRLCRLRGPEWAIFARLEVPSGDHEYNVVLVGDRIQLLGKWPVLILLHRADYVDAQIENANAVLFLGNRY